MTEATLPSVRDPDRTKPYWIKTSTDEELAEPCKGACLFCKARFSGTAAEVISAQARHRDVCEHRPESTKRKVNGKRVRDSSYNAPYLPATIAAIGELGRQGLPIAQICEELTARGIEQPNGKPWNKNHIERVRRSHPETRPLHATLRAEAQERAAA
jgi:hypothetical protein